MKSYNEIEKLATYTSKNKKHCKYCGYPVFMIKSFRQNKVLCKVCGHYIYKDDKVEFEERLKNAMKK